jgi:hypothetical protein
MAYIIVPSRRLQQPQTLLSLNRYYLKNLKAGIIPRYFQSAFDPVSNQLLVGENYGVSQLNTYFKDKGIISIGSVSSANFYKNNVGEIGLSAEITLISCVVGNTSIITATQVVAIKSGNGGGFTEFGMNIGDNTNSRFNATSRYGGSNNSFGSSGETQCIQNKLHVIGIRCKSGLQELWVDGQKSSSQGSQIGVLGNIPNYLVLSSAPGVAVGISLIYNEWKSDQFMRLGLENIFLPNNNKSYFDLPPQLDQITPWADSGGYNVIGGA